MPERLAKHEYPAVYCSYSVKHDLPRLQRLAVDGKTVKGSRQANGKPLHLLAAVSPESQRLVAQEPVDEKSNEITALRPMLKDVPLDGVVVTADAMHTQQDAARFLQQEKGGSI